MSNPIREMTSSEKAKYLINIISNRESLIALPKWQEDFLVVTLEKEIPKPLRTETYEYGADADGNRGVMVTDTYCPNCEQQLDGEPTEYCPCCGQRLETDKPFKEVSDAERK